MAVYKQALLSPIVRANYSKGRSTTTSYSRFPDRQGQINRTMMQAAVALSAVLPVAVRGRPPARRRSATAAGGRRLVGAGVRASAAAAPEADYSSNVSVFPMEACDLVGGEACDAQMYPETKLGAGTGGPAAAVARAPEVEREYLAYDEPKTVFPDEACDDLGGEFCEAPYQTSK